MRQSQKVKAKVKKKKEGEGECEEKKEGEGEGEGEGEEKKEEVFKITNATLDSSSFRAALLACAVTGSVIVEINISMCQVTPAQIMDLTKALEVLGPKCRSLKLNHLHNIQNTEDYHDCITKLISIMGLQYLSLQGNGFDDNFVSNTIGPALKTNYTLKSLNLSDNGITDKGANTLFHALRHRTNLTHISLRSNSLTGSFLSDTLAKLVTGRMEVTADDEAYIKGISKEFGNKNKTIKDLNKKRKGAGQQEYMEIPEQASLMKTAKDSSSVLMNKSIAVVDISLAKMIDSNEIQKAIDETKETNVEGQDENENKTTIVAKMSHINETISTESACFSWIQ